MTDVPTFEVRLPLRCFGRNPIFPSVRCGGTARFVRYSEHDAEPQYFCQDHRRKGDAPIPEQPLYRRVSVSVEIYLASAALPAAAAEAEGIALIQRALGHVGAVAHVLGARSLVGRAAGPASRQGNPRTVGRV